MVASTAMSTGMVTVVAIPIWLSAAIRPSAMTKMAATRARVLPYDSPPNTPARTSRTALAMATDITTMSTATIARGSQATISFTMSLMALGPKGWSASWSASSRMP